MSATNTKEYIPIPTTDNITNFPTNKSIISTHNPDQLPVMLVHGMSMRDYSIDESPLWGRIPLYLRFQGNPVYFGNQDGWGDTQHNANQLTQTIEQILDETGAGKVHIIAHSKGGLDTYHIENTDDIAGHIASITALSCPTRGLKMCDFLSHIPIVFDKIIDPIIKKLALRNGDERPNPIGVLKNLTTKNRESDYHDFAPIPDVEYRSYAFVTDCMGDDRKYNFRNWFIGLFDGENDGVVPLWSTKSKNWHIVKSKPGRPFHHDDVTDYRKRDTKLKLLDDETIYNNTPELICHIVNELDENYVERRDERTIAADEVDRYEIVA